MRSKAGWSINRDLKQMCDQGTFRSDLYFRLNAITLHVPPWRDRRDDIPSLVAFFLRNHGFSRRIDKSVAPAAMRALVGYDWPGNVRELRNVIERAVIMSGETREIRPEHLGLPESMAAATGSTRLAFDHEPTLDELKRAYLAQLMERYAGNRAQIARVLGASERNTYRLIDRYGLDPSTMPS